MYSNIINNNKYYYSTYINIAYGCESDKDIRK